MDKYTGLLYRYPIFAQTRKDANESKDSKGITHYHDRISPSK